MIDAQVLLRDGQVYMRKRCDDHGWFEGLIYADARAYVDQAKYNKPGQAPARISTEVSKGVRAAHVGGAPRATRATRALCRPLPKIDEDVGRVTARGVRRRR